MTTILERVHGQLRVRPWPAQCIVPHAATSMADGSCTGPLSLRARVRRDLLAAGVPFVDLLAPPPLPAAALPAPVVPPPAAFDAWRRHGGNGVVVGLGPGEQTDLVLAAMRHAAARTLLLACDSGAELAWQQRLRERPGGAVVDVATVGAAAQRFAGALPRHDLLVVALPERMPAASLASALAGLAPAHLLALVDHVHADLIAVSAWAGPVLQVVRRAAHATQVELHLPLAAAERAVHDAAWHEFLCGFDAFAALRPTAEFAVFVREARREPAWRPALLAWHRARAVAAWNTAKAAACGELLARHRGASVLVFTPDRGSAYELARAHLVAPLTAELPRAERAAVLAAFAAGSLRVLVGPRLLESGVPAGRADVGIVIGGGFGLRDRRTRHDRVRSDGVVYDLIAADTAEVGRARRFADALRG
ncbi:MAG: hypothetical protein JNL08_00785 [Planctomycetes bacterium]|nr:hypothetical protein [Planctomycetota bacterium]